MSASRAAGSSRKELLAVLAVVILLAAVGTTWRVKVMDTAKRTVCGANLKTLSVGFQQYVEPARQLPSTARLGDVKADDWIYWQRDRRFEGSVIGSGISNFSGRILWCPADMGASSRDYPYSFSMNHDLDRADPEWIGNGTSLILLSEEESPNDGDFLPGAESDVLTRRHFGRGNALFFDGHVEMLTRHAARKAEHSRIVERPPGDTTSGGLPPKDVVSTVEFPEPKPSLSQPQFGKSNGPVSAIEGKQNLHFSLFASEPDVKQPIAFAIDERGRLWVAECYSYPSRKGDPPSGTGGIRPSKEQLADIFGGKDRILIFEDADGDGKFDKRTVFLEKLNFITGLEVGFGGVWIGAVPYLMFVPVKEWDSPKPGGDPQILLDGWDYTHEKTHEVLNTFTWGPDGWLYGNHGAFENSLVGKPGSPKEQRQWVDASTWRYHPIRHEFEVFAEGMMNSWGLDFDENGQFFASGCVIPHLFHLIQGGRYQRGAGQHFPVGADETQRFAGNKDGRSEKPLHPFIYEDIKTIADHLHYQGNQWNGADRRSSIEIGGGHSHAGLLCYQGDSFPTPYRGKLFMNNIHGARINMDIPERSGSGFVGKHGPDFINFHDTWSQVLNLRTGPDGSIFMIDWYDREQCHEQDPTRHDRSNGRIYKVSYGNRRATGLDLQKLSNEELAQLLTHSNSWHFRQAAHVLHHRFGNSPDQASLAVKLFSPILNQSTDRLHRLRALWAMHRTARPFNSPEFAAKYLKDEDEYIRAWTIQFACEDRNVSSALLVEFERLAREDKSPVVRLYLASALQRIPIPQRGPILEALVAHEEDASDHNLPLMYWFAAEPVVSQDVTVATKLLAKTQIPQVREYITRRMASGY